VALAGVGGCCVMVGTPVDICGWGRVSRGVDSIVGLMGAPLVPSPDPDQSRCRFSSARNAASHLISSSSDGAQRTKVRLAVTTRNRCSSTAPAPLGPA